MPQKNNFNINISKDDINTNDYLCVWSELIQRPNKITIYNHYDPDSFFGMLSQFDKQQNISTVSDVIPTGQDYLVNERSLVRLTETIFVSYSQLDKLTDSKIIGDVSFYFTNESILQVQDLIDKLSETEINYQDSDSQERFNSLVLSPEGLEIESINLLETDYENIDLYYNDCVIKNSKKAIKEIKKKNKGLTVIFGQRGTGKTHLINYIVSSLDKLVIFIPSTMIDHTINNPDFINFIRRYQNSVVVIDDCETLFTDIYRKSTMFVNNLLQLIDGYQSDLLNLNFILSLNLEKDELYDKTLLDCNNLIVDIEVDYLEVQKIKDLCEHLKFKIKIKDKAKLNDVINKKNIKSDKMELGFN